MSARSHTRTARKEKRRKRRRYLRNLTHEQREALHVRTTRIHERTP